MPPKLTKHDGWVVYKPKDFEKEAFDAFKGTVHIFTSFANGNCGTDSIATVANVESTPALFKEMRSFARKSVLHEIKEEFDPDENENYWLDKEDVAYICLEKYGLFPIIYNGLWNPKKKEPVIALTDKQKKGLNDAELKEKLDEKIARRNRKLTSRPNQPVLVCPEFWTGKNYYTQPKPDTKYVIIKMVGERHYQPLGVLVGDEMKTQFQQKEIPDFFLKHLKDDCFHEKSYESPPATKTTVPPSTTKTDVSRIEIEIKQLTESAKDSSDIFSGFTIQDFVDYYKMMDDDKSSSEAWHEAQLYGKYYEGSATDKQRKELSAVYFCAFTAAVHNSAIVPVSSKPKPRSPSPKPRSPSPKPRSPKKNSPPKSPPKPTKDIDSDDSKGRPKRHAKQLFKNYNESAQSGSFIDLSDSS